MRLLARTTFLWTCFSAAACVAVASYAKDLGDAVETLDAVRSPSSPAFPLQGQGPSLQNDPRVAVHPDGSVTMRDIPVAQAADGRIGVPGQPAMGSITVPGAMMRFGEASVSGSGANAITIVPISVAAPR